MFLSFKMPRLIGDYFKSLKKKKNQVTLFEKVIFPSHCILEKSDEVDYGGSFL